jgi:hypothetical protein
MVLYYGLVIKTQHPGREHKSCTTINLPQLARPITLLEKQKLPSQPGRLEILNMALTYRESDAAFMARVARSTLAATRACLRALEFKALDPLSVCSDMAEAGSPVSTVTPIAARLEFSVRQCEMETELLALVSQALGTRPSPLKP